MNQLNNRFKLISDKTFGQDSIVDSILSDPTQGDYTRALEVNAEKLKRNYVEATLLASDDLEAISEILEMPSTTLLMYKMVFYDVSGLTKLDKLSHIDSIDDEAERVLKIWALSEGLTFISWRLGNDVSIEPTEGLNQLFSMCIFKAREAMFSSNKTVSSRESAKWVKLSLDIAKILKLWVTDSRAAVQDLELAIKSVVPDFKGITDLS